MMSRRILKKYASSLCLLMAKNSLTLSRRAREEIFYIGICVCVGEKEREKKRKR